jgi:hypothetical protein
MTIQAGSKWVDAIRSTVISGRLDLVGKRPIIVWFNENRKEVRRLIKVTPRLGDDVWLIHGWNTLDGKEGLSVEPTNLDKALRHLTPENGWVLCEFENEIKFYTEALRYLQEN